MTTCAAEQEIIAKHLYLVEKMAAHFRRPGFDDEEMLGEAFLGLARAARDFIPERGAFRPFAIFIMKQYLHDYVNTRSCSVKIPVYMRDLIGLFRRKANEMAAQLRRDDISDREVMDAMGLDSRDRKRLSQAIQLQRCKDGTQRLRYGDQGDERFDPRASDPESVFDDVVRRCEAEIVRKAVGRLRSLLRETLMEHFGLGDGPPLALDEIARRRGVSYERVRQLRNAGLCKLRLELQKEGLTA